MRPRKHGFACDSFIGGNICGKSKNKLIYDDIYLMGLPLKYDLLFSRHFLFMKMVFYKKNINSFHYTLFCLPQI